ncbi:DNA alkylation repair protein [Algivirga pacifica]|uniref:DNA alkylation repair protein n=1 Tax=Algivirga pacifica TaxID=1162670 RepID=A0ABP9D4D1_9BACT
MQDIVPHTFFLEALLKKMENHRDEQQASKMKTYMKNHFEFYGIQQPLRKQVLKDIMRQYELPKGEEFYQLLQALWMCEERECQYLALDLMDKRKQDFTAVQIPLLEYMVQEKSWWDTVDLLASRQMGKILLEHRELMESKVEEWLSSGNLWLQRTALLFQLKYKEQTDWNLLFACIESLKESKEFFIQKAIGWTLREYGKTAPQRVMLFVEDTPLAPLSKREALKHLK